jgi:co-chaperonin GroES (HSP10)
MLKPFHALVTVILDPKITKTPGGISLPDTSEVSYRLGTVRAAGPEARYALETTDGSPKRQFPLQPGDRVMVAVQKDKMGHVLNMGTIMDDGLEVVLVNYHDIWGIIPADPKELN